ncbi:DNA polymerase III subunit beta [Dactylosporangium sp. NPDC000555]|uniref:DNA polymerase III subunit beta n=1 Tax=Dactylosporangium sp. NPDC000555 TaxID=3154260 RepID=UPI00331C46BB
MTRLLDVTAPVRLLAEAAALAVRLITGRSPHPVHAAALLRADEDGLALSATDGALTVRLRVPATVHEPGEALVSRRGLADTVAGLDAPEARLVAEGSRMAVRVPGARFALPVLADAWPPAAALPPETGRAPGPALRTATAAVAGAASREHALPIFTGVRLRAVAGGMSLLATDRYRLAVATVPVEAPAPFDALVPAGLLARVAPVLGRAETVSLHAAGELFGLSWPGGSVTTPTLGDTYPDLQFDRLLDVTPECVVELDADALAHAVDRAAAYAGEQGRVTLQSIEGAVLVQASDPLRGESEETVKAAVRSGQATRSYQARLLADALGAFPGETVQLRVQPALRATEVTTATADLRYLIVPMRRPDPA